MDIEMALQNVLQEQTKEYIKKVKDMNEYLKGKTNEYLQALNDEIEKYQDDLKTEAYDHLEEWTKQQNANNAGDDYEDDAESAAQNSADEEEELAMFQLFAEGRENLQALLDQSTEHYRNEVGRLLGDVTKRTTNEWNTAIDNLTNGQLARNRAIVKEIIDTVAHFTAEIDDEVASMKGDPEDDYA